MQLIPAPAKVLPKGQWVTTGPSDSLLDYVDKVEIGRDLKFADTALVRLVARCALHGLFERTLLNHRLIVQRPKELLSSCSPDSAVTPVK